MSLSNIGLGKMNVRVGLGANLRPERPKIRDYTRKRIFAALVKRLHPHVGGTASAVIRIGIGLRVGRQSHFADSTTLAYVEHEYTLAGVMRPRRGHSKLRFLLSGVEVPVAFRSASRFGAVRKIQLYA